MWAAGTEPSSSLCSFHGVSVTKAGENRHPTSASRTVQNGPMLRRRDPVGKDLIPARVLG